MTTAGLPEFAAGWRSILNCHRRSCAWSGFWERFSARHSRASFCIWRSGICCRKNHRPRPALNRRRCSRGRNRLEVMAENEQTKVCPLCAETIKAAAKVCPHCRHWQTKPLLTNLQVMQSIASVMLGVGIIAAIIGLVIFLQHLIGPKRDFTPYRNQIAVVSSEESFKMFGSNLTVFVVGVITNQSDFAWKNVGLEARLFDKDGKLIDVIQASDSSYSGVVVLPHAEAGFKIQSKATKNESDYVTNKVIVGTAKDFKAWP